MRLLPFLLGLLLIGAPAPASFGQSPAPAPGSTPAPLTGSAKWEQEIAAFEAQDAKSPPPKHALLFIGSSSMRFWQGVAKDFPHHQVINRGFGGSEVSDSVAFVDRIVLPYEPRAIYFYAGGNDINAGKAPETVAENFRLFATEVHAKLPETEIHYVSVAPNPKRWAQLEKIKRANGLIQQYCQETPHLKFIDVFSKMLGEDGLPKNGIYRDDQLHMNLEGYKIWTEAFQPYLPAPDKE